MHLDSPSTAAVAQSGPPKRNWPLIVTATLFGLLVLTVVVGSIVLYVTQFNLLEWLE